VHPRRLFIMSDGAGARFLAMLATRRPSIGVRYSRRTTSAPHEPGRHSDEIERHLGRRYHSSLISKLILAHEIRRRDKRSEHAVSRWVRCSIGGRISTKLGAAICHKTGCSTTYASRRHADPPVPAVG